MKNKFNLLKVNRLSISPFGHVCSKLVNAMLSRNRRPLIIGLLARVSVVIGVRISPFRYSIICMYVRAIVHIHKTQGMKGLVKYLKAMGVLIQQSIGGHILRDVGPLGPRVGRNRRGLPRLIPSQDRAQIRAGNPKVIKFWLTLVNIYRVLDMPGRISTNSIVEPSKEDPSMGSERQALRSLLSDFASLVVRLSGKSRLHTRTLFPKIISKSSPGTAGPLISSNPLMLILSAMNLERVGLSGSVRFFLRRFSQTEIPGLTDGHVGRAYDACLKCQSLPLLPTQVFELGRLGLKFEAAGKVRVFAMVDSWTQWCLAPLHEEIFSVLRRFPTDGTFNQFGPVGNYTSWPSAYSLDLTAATDRLPMDIQEQLIALLYGVELAAHWRKLLTDRTYVLPASKLTNFEDIEARYAVGQPMGALSSWASLALIHHAIVNISAWQSGVIPVGSLYPRYAILGDDLVIGDRLVKDRYLVNCRALGVEIGLHKSLLSSRAIAIEFAKHTFYKGVDVSPVPLLEFMVANTGLPNAMQFAHKYALTLPRLLKSLGFGYRVLGSLYRHVGLMNARVRLLYMAYQVPILTEASEDSYASFLSIGNRKRPVMPEIIQGMISSFTQRAERSLVEAGKSNLGMKIRAARDFFMSQLLNRHFIRLLLDSAPAGPVGFHNPLLPRIGMMFSNPIMQWNLNTVPGLARATRFVVPESTFDTVREALVSWRHALYMIIMMMYYAGDDERTGALKELSYQLSLFPRMITLNVSYPRLIRVLKEIDGLSVLNEHFIRENAEPRIVKDSIHLRLWRAWTAALAKAVTP